MQTNLAQDLLATDEGKTADKILRSCVHCGFCLSTCPTYSILGDELDSPRGRIYLIKSLLEGNSVGVESLKHLDRCLTCQSCETTCPSGVEYSHLLDIGRRMAEAKAPLQPWRTLKRFVVRKTLTTAWLFNGLVTIFPFVKHSETINFNAEQTALKQKLQQQPSNQQKRVLLLSGCVQPALAPNINTATTKVLNRLGIQVIESGQQQCCGGLDQHLSAEEDAKNKIRQNIDAWWPLVEQGLLAIISNASGCGVMLKDYAHIMQNDQKYAAKAARISELSQDISEFLIQQDLSIFTHYKNHKVTFHAPCTLQHGQKLPGLVEDTLRRLGYRVTAVKDAHMCCGSAGTYSLLEPKLAKQLRQLKLTNLEAGKPPIIVTANIGCLMHLQKGTDTPIKHWIELL